MGSVVLSLITPASLVSSEASPSQPPLRPEPEDTEKNLLLFTQHVLFICLAIHLSIHPASMDTGQNENQETGLRSSVAGQPRPLNLEVT